MQQSKYIPGIHVPSVSPLPFVYINFPSVCLFPGGRPVPWNKHRAVQNWSCVYRSRHCKGSGIVEPNGTR